MIDLIEPVKYKFLYVYEEKKLEWTNILQKKQDELGNVANKYNEQNWELTQTPSSKHDEVYLMNSQVCERKK